MFKAGTSSCGVMPFPVWCLRSSFWCARDVYFNCLWVERGWGRGRGGTVWGRMVFASIVECSYMYM